MPTILSTIAILAIVVTPGFSDDAKSGPWDSPIPLLPGYRHEPGPRRDSVAGTIVKPDGPNIFYEYGGNASFDGDLKALVPNDQMLWYKEYSTDTRHVQLAMQKGNILRIAYGMPRRILEVRGIKSDEEVAEVVLMAWAFAPELLTKADAINIAKKHLKQRDLAWGAPMKVKLLEHKMGFLIWYDTPPAELDRLGQRVVSVNRWNGAVGVLARR